MLNTQEQAETCYGNLRSRFHLKNFRWKAYIMWPKNCESSIEKLFCKRIPCARKSVQGHSVQIPELPKEVIKFQRMEEQGVLCRHVWPFPVDHLKGQLQKYGSLKLDSPLPWKLWQKLASSTLY
ncbi:hypothetical protein CEXT_670141 [Caerostris extrusa]|uniref:Uncharacterized protein n=1 Tax=Caerostris extrusa TaxID=172846 RepID=A0AAV4WK79_CAEEX|nr:hypothetical protein CEXT_670141 [Caerostris extrusa]